MYPFRDDNVFVRNAWYAAALRSEITREPMERTICEEPIVFYRTEAGEPVAMYGLCPHRFYPLAKGKVVGDAIECGYHGFTFDGRGKCIRIPQQQDKGAGYSQRTYPVIDFGPYTWVWCGDPAQADQSKLPDLDYLGIQANGEAKPGYALWVDKGKPFASRSQLIVDNLMDLTHFAFLHHGQVDSPGLVKKPLRVEPFGNQGIAAVRQIENGSWDAFCDFAYLPENRYESADFLSKTVLLSPGLLASWSFEFTSVNGKPDIPAGLGHVFYIHAITPSTKHSSFYFQCNTRNFRTEDAQFHEFHGQLSSRIVDEDIEAVEAMEPRLDHASSIQHELNARSDLGGIKAREHLQMMIDRENGLVPEPVPV